MYHPYEDGRRSLKVSHCKPVPSQVVGYTHQRGLGVCDDSKAKKPTNETNECDYVCNEEDDDFCEDAYRDHSEARVPTRYDTEVFGDEDDYGVVNQETINSSPNSSLGKKVACKQSPLTSFSDNPM